MTQRDHPPEHADDPRGGYRGPRPARVSVSGQGSAAATPDVVRVSLGVRADATGVAAALTAANEAVRGISAAARRHGLADRDIASTSASVQPRWNGEGTTVVGYTAYHQVSMRVRELARLNDLVDAVAAAAGNALVIDGITLEVADQAPLLERARAAAFADALAKARQYAALTGTRVGRVLEVLEGGAGGGGPEPMMLRAAKSYGADSVGGMPVEAGEHTVSAAVHLTWALEPLAPGTDSPADDPTGPESGSTADGAGAPE